ncbi:PAS domain-containing sensor histidine kinase [bacterium]|nr:PAS domain-containing sensor histidine kinase [bacterium]
MEMFRDFIDSATEGFILFDSEMNTLMINGAMLEMLRKKKNDVLGKNLTELFPDMKDSGGYDRCMDVLETGKPFELDYAVSRKIFSTQNIYLKVFRAGDGLGMTVNDISDRKEIEDALVESRQKYQTVFHKANDFMVLIDEDGKVLDVNDRSRDFLGYSKYDYIGKTLFELPILNEESKKVAVDNFLQRMKGEAVQTYELEMVKQDGETVIGEVNGALIELANNRRGDLIIIRDVTGRKKAEKERLDLISKLQEKTEELNTILENVGDGIITVNNEYTITAFNNAFSELVGLPREEIIGKPCYDIIRCVDNDRNDLCNHSCGLEQTLLKGLTFVERSIIQHRDDTTTTVESVNSPLKSVDGSIIGAVKSIRDITKEAEIEHMKEEFVSTVSHELRTPLTAIQGYIDLILAGETGEINDVQREFLDMVSRNSERLTLLINDLLDIEKLEAVKLTLRMQKVSLSDLVRYSANTLRHNALEKKLDYILDIKNGIEGYFDQDKITQIMLNLISNAIKFTPEGSVTIKLDERNNKAEISILDTGIGISPADRKKLFTKFFRAETPLVKKIPGTGLGLSIVKKLIEVHKGKIIVSSDTGKGSEFLVVLPLEKRGTAGRSDRKTV